MWSPCPPPVRGGLTKATVFGLANPETGVATIAKQAGQIPDTFDPTPIYTNEFVDAANAFDRAAVIKQAKESKW